MAHVIFRSSVAVRAVQGWGVPEGQGNAQASRARPGSRGLVPPPQPGSGAGGGSSPQPCPTQPWALLSQVPPAPPTHSWFPSPGQILTLTHRLTSQAGSCWPWAGLKWRPGPQAGWGGPWGRVRDSEASDCPRGLRDVSRVPKPQYFVLLQCLVRTATSSTQKNPQQKPQKKLGFSFLVYNQNTDGGQDIFL